MRPVKKRKGTQTTIAWSADLGALFGPFSGRWTPPDRVVVYRSADGRRFTFKAKFKADDGIVWTSTVRVRGHLRGESVKTSDVAELFA